MSKHQYLISKYHWQSRQKFHKTLRGFRNFVFRYRVKNENAKLEKRFLQRILSFIGQAILQAKVF